jgi:hypothetical protein
MRSRRSPFGAMVYINISELMLTIRTSLPITLAIFCGLDRKQLRGESWTHVIRIKLKILKLVTTIRKWLQLQTRDTAIVRRLRNYINKYFFMTSPLRVVANDI